mmetsp:Transcript_28647/g.43274  ORF Transcript_28647/g.43274 Transcript_28647/m.43274 type:complete len:82 (+) Transcript_28647:111-356(+)
MNTQEQLTHVVMQNGGYGNIVYNLLFLIQIRLTKFFNGEEENDKEFQHFFLKVYDMMHTQEQKVGSPISFTNCVKDLVDCV